MTRVVRTCLTVGVCLAVMSWRTPASADVHYWNDTNLTGDWNDPANWSLGVVPLLDGGGHGHVVIYDASIVAGGTMPIINSAVPDISHLTPGWHTGATPVDHVAFVDGADLTCTVADSLGQSNYLDVGLGTGVLSMYDGSVHDAVSLYLGTDFGLNGQMSRGYIHLNGGDYEFINFFLDGGNTGAEANLDIEPGARLIIGQEVTQTSLDFWFDKGYVSAMDFTGTLNLDWNGEIPNKTVITAVDPYGAPFYTADFEDGEINPGRWPDSGLINTTAYSATQPEAFSTAPGAEPDGDAFGWQNRAAQHTGGDTTIVDGTEVTAFTGENCAKVQNRTLRSDIEMTIQEGMYRFTFWYMVPRGNDLTFWSKMVMKDQTNGYVFPNTGNNDDYTTAPAHDVWFSRTITIDTTGYAPAVAGELIDFRFGIWMAKPGVGGETWYAYTDNWSLCYKVAPDPVPTEPNLRIWSPRRGNSQYGSGVDPCQWDDNANWTRNGYPVGKPGATETARINESNSLDGVTHQDVRISNDAGVVDWLQMAYTTPSTIGMRVYPGGSLVATTGMNLKQGALGHVSVDMMGDALTTGTLFMTEDTTPDGNGEYIGNTTYINMDAGKLVINDDPGIGWAVDTLSIDGNIDLEIGHDGGPPAMLIMDGDHSETGTGALPWWVAIGLVTVGDGINYDASRADPEDYYAADPLANDQVHIDFNVTHAGKTTIWAEPYSLVRNGGFNTPSVSQKRWADIRQGVQNFDMNTTGWAHGGWGYTVGSGIMSEGHPWLASVVPDANGRSPAQAALLIAYTTGTAQMYMDIPISEFTPEEVYIVNWSEALGYVESPGAAPEMPNFTVTMYPYTDGATGWGTPQVVGDTPRISNPTLEPKCGTFVPHLLDGTDNVLGYRLLFDARDTVDAGWAMVIVDSVSVVPGEHGACCATCGGDIDGSDVVDYDDLDEFVVEILEDVPHACTDVNEDGKVDGLDIQLFIDRVLWVGGAGYECDQPPPGTIDVVRCDDPDTCPTTGEDHFCFYFVVDEDVSPFESCIGATELPLFAPICFLWCDENPNPCPEEDGLQMFRWKDGIAPGEDCYFVGELDGENCLDCVGAWQYKFRPAP